MCWRGQFVQITNCKLHFVLNSSFSLSCGTLSKQMQYSTIQMYVDFVNIFVCIIYIFEEKDCLNPKMKLGYETLKNRVLVIFYFCENMFCKSPFCFRSRCSTGARHLCSAHWFGDQTGRKKSFKDRNRFWQTLPFLLRSLRTRAQKEIL